MSETTPNLALPFILPSQAQKHVTHNESLLALDAAVQLVLTGSGTAPSAITGDGQCFAIEHGASGEWLGRSGQIAAWQDGAWSFLQPRTGWTAFDLSTGMVKAFDGSTWQPLALPSLASFSQLGVNATSDETNRLTASAAATLLTHEGAGHQLKINKAAAGETASLLFQSNWEGRAEMGLAGSDTFSLKVSGDGERWTTALAVGSDGIARTETRPAVRCARFNGDAQPATGTLTGFSNLSPSRGGFTLGEVVAADQGNRLLVPADGIYLVALKISVLSATGYGLRLMKNGAVPILSLEGPSVVSGPVNQSAICVAALQQNDWLALEHIGSATIRFGFNGTELSLAMI